eukprot:TRINITY_DN105251_c1_g1_i1.p1 TRINITY_DN105251_c1_g1~~TRINITY_DN105251_c1_g1_i1.p1  ORF type:complete len:486 (-),score=40.00 TRINITY_DN105251_c1_g1_i1:87-1544(-)
MLHLYHCHSSIALRNRIQQYKYNLQRIILPQKLFIHIHNRLLLSIQQFGRIMISRLNRAFSTLQKTCPWKLMDFYYNYDFATKLSFIDHKMRFPLFRVIDKEGKVLAPEFENIDKDLLLKAFNLMVTCREMDVVFNNAQRQNRVSFYMTSTYEEATNVGAISAINPQDAVFVQYREHGMFLWRGLKPIDIVNNCKGNRDDISRGRALALTNCAPKQNIFPNSGPLGNRNPHAAGAGYFFRTKGMDRISMCVFGEGAASTGDFHASMNFAATLGSQTLFYCRNNAYAISTFRDEQYAGDGIAPRGIGYGMPAIKVDGNDFLAVHNAVKKAREMIIERKGPVLVESYTYRGGDHSTSDSSATYRIPNKMGPMLKYFESLGDPITRLGKYLELKGHVKDYQKEVKETSAKAREQCLADLRKIDQTKMDYYKRMFEGVYKEMPANLKEQSEDLEETIKRYPGIYPLKDFPPNQVAYQFAQHLLFGILTN